VPWNFRSASRQGHAILSLQVPQKVLNMDFFSDLRESYILFSVNRPISTPIRARPFIEFLKSEAVGGKILI
jgi:hypothetical protein